jgi:hypothetical protein
VKDPRGHGSDGRDGGSFSKRQQIGISMLGPGFSGRQLSPQTKTQVQRTVTQMRERLHNTGPGHSSALMQGIRNLLGGGS